MALYTIGDLHLSLGSDKTMEVFGEAWAGYVERIAAGFSTLHDDDVTVLCGDLSWGMSLEESLADLKYIDALPGRKILMKGNHDYWWNTAAKMRRFFAEHGLETLDILHNNCLWYGDKALCGTRGWFYELDQNGHDEKVLLREAGRLETSLKAAGTAEKLCFLHYADGIRRETMLVRASPRPHPATGRGRADVRHGIFPGCGGLSAVCAQKNLRLRQKGMEIRRRFWYNTKLH